jgi:hypothetical protein
VIGAERRKFDAMMEAWNADPWVVAEDTAASSLGVAALAADTDITISPLAVWMDPDCYIVISLPGGDAVRKIVSRTGYQLSLDAALGENAPAGTKVRLGMLGYMQPTLSATRITDSIIAVPVVIEEYPGNNAYLNPTSASVTLDGFDVFESAYNWAAPVNLDYVNHVRVVDFGRGRLSRLNPANHNTRDLRATYLCKTQVQARSLFGFIMRQKGMRGSFRYSTFAEDLIPISGSAGDTFFNVSESLFYATYPNSKVYTAVEITYPGGNIQRVTIQSVQLSGSVKFNLRAPLDENIVGAKVSWLPMCRFASDSFTFDWKTDSVCEVQLSIRTIEDLSIPGTISTETTAGLEIAGTAVSINGTTVSMT